MRRFGPLSRPVRVAGVRQAISISTELLAWPAMSRENRIRVHLLHVGPKVNLDDVTWSTEARSALRADGLPCPGRFEELRRRRRLFVPITAFVDTSPRRVGER